MNNNNSNRNNRRRGRGNRPQQGGGNQNRIDSRARGNAPQMFEKYRKLAQDAAHNGDRVQAEYFLQFADHYFRVIADNKARQDETRGGARRDERDFQAEDEGEEDEFDLMRPPQSSGRFNDRQIDRPADRQSDRPNDRQRSQPRRDDGNRSRDEGERAYEGEPSNDLDPTENPFTRGDRNRDRDRGRPRENDRPRDAGREAPRDGEVRRGRSRRPSDDGTSERSPVGDGGEIDASALPPSFSSSVEPVAEESSPKRKLPPRRRRPTADETGDDGETLKAVG